MAHVALFFLLLLLIPGAYFTYQVWSFDPGVDTQVQGSRVKADVFAKSVAVAKAYWRSRGVDAPCGKIRGTVLPRIPVLSRMEPDAGAREGICEILFRRGWYVVAKQEPARFCTIVVHESGHIFGLDHVGDKRNIMHSPQLFILRECRVLAKR